MKSTLAKISLFTILVTASIGTALAAATGPWCQQFQGATLTNPFQQGGGWHVFHDFPPGSRWGSIVISIFDKDVINGETAIKRGGEILNAAADYSVGDTLLNDDGTYLDRCKYLIPLKYSRWGDQVTVISNDYSDTSAAENKGAAIKGAGVMRGANMKSLNVRALEKATKN